MQELQELLKVKIVNGVYGHIPAGGKRVRPVFPGGLAEVEAGEAQRLVKLGVAVYADEQELKLPEHGSVGASMQMSAKELKALLEEAGIPYRQGMTKAEMIAVLENAEEADDEDADDAYDENNAPPEVGAEGPVV